MNGIGEEETQVHLLAIRKALANRNAAVMIGAGFSRNANGGENLATWSQLAEALSVELEPGRSLKDFTPASASQLAEQYARVFSPTHLEQLIKRCVPDDQVTPGDLHARLLKLPWSEVFTTNYDTLLERAAEKIFDASYTTVCAREDIPQSKILGRRRIVKLHGSFPSHRPFILTEEEYRTYPERFAPFVNLVRQSLLENVFCLIGFSGDDPNFLHWLGWVRDMLDRHALPVYLFLSRAPTLGERKLYEARGVVPVVLPSAPDGRHGDYQARYRQLFVELAKPLEDSPLDWGEVPHLNSVPFGRQGEKALDEFLEQVLTVATYRDTYPEWIVAPREVRSRFRATSRWLEESLSQQWLRDLLAEAPATVSLCVVDLYCWSQSVVLGPLLDDIAELGLRTLSKSAQPAARELDYDIARFLTAMRGLTSADSQAVRARVSVALLTWSRQSHRISVYRDLKGRLQSLAERDAVLGDRLVYEETLHCLQRSDSRSALQLLRQWRPGEANVYAQVLRGVLMAEVGDPNASLQILEHAIQILRRQQRSRPESVALISQESWACLAADLLQRLETWGIMPKAAESTHPLQDQPTEREDFDLRLNVLGRRGYSAREELKALEADLNAEAELPGAELRELVGFDLWSISRHRRLGAPSELRDKVAASFAWLEMIERVGLPLHAPRASFFTSEMLQAAWWSRFAERPERSTGLLLRANRKNSLEPLDRSNPHHLTGWLRRCDVALLSEDAAIEIAEELVQQLVLDLDSPASSDPSDHRSAFRLTVIGRVAIRICDQEVLQRLGLKLVGLYQAHAFQLTPPLWDSAADALGHVLEALSGAGQESLLAEIFRLPVLPPSQIGPPSVRVGQFFEWAEIGRITHRLDTPGGESGAWREIAEKLISDLSSTSNPRQHKQAWRRLAELRRLNLLTEVEESRVGDILWAGISADGWPGIAGFFPTETLNWPVPRHRQASILLDRLLAVPFRPYASGGMVLSLSRVGRSYSFGHEEEVVRQVQFTLSRQAPTLKQIGKLTEYVAEWLDYQLAGLVQDIESNEDLHASLENIVASIDEILATCLKALSKRKLTNTARDLVRRFVAIDERLSALPYLRVESALALVSIGEFDVSAVDDGIKTIVRQMTSEESRVCRRAFRVAYSVLVHDDRSVDARARLVFDAAISCTFARRPTCLLQALSLLKRLPADSLLRFLEDRHILLLDSALAELAESLDYSRSPSTDTMPVESVPVIRFQCTELAKILLGVRAGLVGASRWLQLAAHDPLPELRLRATQSS